MCRHLAWLFALVLVLAACGVPSPESEIAEPSTLQTSTLETSTTTDAIVTTSTRAPTTPTSTPPTTTTVPSETRLPILVTSDQGVFRVESTGAVTRLVREPVARAVDDGEGGLLYQLHAGRFTDQPDPLTIVYWVPAGEEAPRELLVTGAGTDLELTLHDAWVTEQGFDVLYTRHEGTVPYDDMSDALRFYDTAHKNVTELYRVRGHEWWIEDVSAGAGMILFTEYQLFGRGLVLLDTTGQPIERPGVPASPDCFPSDDTAETSCAYGGTLSSDGTRIGFFVPTAADTDDVVVQSVATAEELARLTPPAALEGRPCGLSLSGSWLIVNTCDPAGSSGHATLFDLGSPDAEPETLSFAGHARFVDAPASFTEDPTITLRADGLDGVVFGQPVDTALPTLEDRLGPPSTTNFVDPLAEEYGLPYGWGAIRYFRYARWDDVGLSVVFSDANYYRDDGEPHLVYWSVDQPGLSDARGVGVGSTPADLLAAYGQALHLPDEFVSDCDVGWRFSIDDSISGKLDGDPSLPTTRVLALEAGRGSSC